MAFISILLADILMLLVLGSAFIALVLFIISMVLFSKNKKAQKEGKANIKKTGAVITLVASMILFLPLLSTVLVTSIYAKVQDHKDKEFIESLDNKVYVKRDEWKSGFEYDGRNLVPVGIFINSDNYRSDGDHKNLEKIGALVIKNTNSYYSLYELDSDSDHEIYYVWVESFRGGEYYSRTFVDEKDYESVMKYYESCDLKINVLWRSAPQETGLSNIIHGLELDIGDHSKELTELSHEVLDDTSGRERVSTSSDGYDEHMEFEIRSTDGVYTVDLVVYTKQDDIELYLNSYKADGETVQKHRDLLLYLVDEAQKELLNKADEAAG